MEKLNKDTFEFIGWLGFALLLVGYALGSLGVWKVNSLVYQSFNFIGSLGLAIIAWRKKDWQLALLNFIWCVIGLIAIVSIVARF